MLNKLHDNLNSKNPTVREAALREGRALSPTLLLQLAEMEYLHFRSKFAATMFLAGISAGVVGGILLGILDLWGWGKWLMRSGFGGAAFPLAFVIFFSLYFGKASWSYRSIATIIEETEDVSFIPAALTILRTPYPGINKSVHTALKRLLPQLRPGQADTWTIEQKRALLALLAMPISNSELTLCVLKALEQIGDEDALPAVRKLAEMKTEFNRWTKPIRMSPQVAAEKALQIKQAALECLPYLEIRRQEKQHAQTLLRASNASESASPATLLRPVQTVISETPTEQLLRSQSSPEG